MTLLPVSDYLGDSAALCDAVVRLRGPALMAELGRIAGLIAEAGAEGATPLQKKLDSFGRILVWVTLGIVVLLFGLGLLRKGRIEVLGGKTGRRDYCGIGHRI